MSGGPQPIDCTLSLPPDQGFSTGTGGVVLCLQLGLVPAPLSRVSEVQHRQGHRANGSWRRHLRHCRTGTGIADLPTLTSEGGLCG